MTKQELIEKYGGIRLIRTHMQGRYVGYISDNVPFQELNVEIKLNNGVQSPYAGTLEHLIEDGRYETAWVLTPPSQGVESYEDWLENDRFIYQEGNLNEGG